MGSMETAELQCPDTHWGLPTWKAALQNSTWGSWWTLSSSEAASALATGKANGTLD